jgi:hypothetical protein
MLRFDSSAPRPDLGILWNVSIFRHGIRIQLLNDVLNGCAGKSVANFQSIFPVPYPGWGGQKTKA